MLQSTLLNQSVDFVVLPKAYFTLMHVRYVYTTALHNRNEE